MEKLTTPQPSARDRSPEYPAEPLRRCIDLAHKLYEQDRQSWTTSETAVKHIGYSSLNGKSRTTLSALRKFGLIEYKGGDLRVSELAMRILVPRSTAERAGAISEALLQPKLYQWFLEQFPGWELPSDETLRARLIRDRGFNPKVVKSVITDLRDALAYTKEQGGSLQSTAPEAEQERPAEGAQTDAGGGIFPPRSDPAAAPIDGHKLSVPGAAWFVFLPEQMPPTDAMRMKRWIDKVLMPQLDFIAGDEADETEDGE